MLFINSRDFNPRSLHGERRPFLKKCCIVTHFNPRSLHGERRHQVQGGHDPWHFNPRSLHGERPENKRKRRTAGNFNPRSLHGERRNPVIQRRFRRRISIHAPCTGSDALTICPVCNAVIFQSTLPARGATRATLREPGTASHFNPRSLHGERHKVGRKPD